jgi:hypothetical protein
MWPTFAAATNGWSSPATLGNPDHLERLRVAPRRILRENRQNMHGRRFQSLRGGAVVAVLLLTACGSAQHRYLADRHEKVYLRVPSSWHELKLSPSIPDPLTQATSEARVISKSVVSPQRNAREQADLDFTEPFATMTVYETTGVFNQQLSPSLARRAAGLVPFDPLLPPTDSQDLAEVMDFDPNPTNAKADGSRVVYRYRKTADSDWLMTVSLSTFFDSSDNRLYALEVACTPDCFDRDAAEINSIVNSWRIG